MAAKIRELQRFQAEPFTFQPIATVQRFLVDIHHPLSEDEMCTYPWRNNGGLSKSMLTSPCADELSNMHQELSAKQTVNDINMSN